MLHSSIDTENAYDEMLDEVNPEVRIGALTYSASRVLKLVDPIAYQMGLGEFIDSLEEDEYIHPSRAEWAKWPADAVMRGE